MNPKLDTHGLQDAMGKLKSDQSPKTLDNLKRELNKFFKESSCTKVFYTKNTDKLFFGMSTYAVLSEWDAKEIITNDKPYRISSYYIEIDSKLLEIGLTTRELTAILLHEVGHLVNDTSPVDTIRKNVDIYMAELGDNVDIASIENALPMFRFAVLDTYRRLTSIFYKRDDEIIADEFVFLCGYGDELQSAFKKIVSQNKNISADVNKLLALDWAFKVYKDMGIHRTAAIKTLNRMKKLTGSVNDQENCDRTIKSLQRWRPIVRECHLNYESIVVIENGVEQPVNEANPGLVQKMRRKGLKGIEEDLYEYQLRIKNVETEEDAMLILRQMNTRMSVLDDYITFADDITEKERAHWEKVYYDYQRLREKMMEKTIWNRKEYGLWYDYGQMRDPNR